MGQHPVPTNYIVGNVRIGFRISQQGSLRCVDFYSILAALIFYNYKCRALKVYIYINDKFFKPKN